MQSTSARAALAAAFILSRDGRRTSRASRPEVLALPRILITVLAAATLAACGDDGHDGDHALDAPASSDGPASDAAPRQIIMEDRPLAPGELVEGILTGGPADVAAIHLEAPVAELDWNIHGHAGGTTQTVAEGFNTMTVDHVFTPAAAAEWWLLLRNSGTTAMTVSVRVDLYGDMQWRWQ